jgi:hypothetical protein
MLTADGDNLDERKREDETKKGKKSHFLVKTKMLEQ